MHFVEGVLKGGFLKWLLDVEWKAVWGVKLLYSESESASRPCGQWLF